MYYMKKIVYFLSVIIVLLLVIIIIQWLKINELSVNRQNVNSSEDEIKKYVGIYHTSYYGHNNTLMEFSIKLQEDGTCEFHSTSNCNWKLESKDLLSITTYTYEGYDKDGNHRASGSKTKEKCEEGMTSINAIGECKKVDEKHNLDIVNSGLMYNDRIYNKIK